MPVLRHGRHENFAQQIAAGKSTTDAYLLAGYKSSRLKARQHGYRLRTREDITARIQELIEKPQNRIATRQIVEAIRTGRPTIYRPELATLARKLALLGGAVTAISYRPSTLRPDKSIPAASLFMNVPVAVRSVALSPILVRLEQGHKGQASQLTNWSPPAHAARSSHQSVGRALRTRKPCRRIQAIRTTPKKLKFWCFFRAEYGCEKSRA